MEFVKGDNIFRPSFKQPQKIAETPQIGKEIRNLVLYSHDKRGPFSLETNSLDPDTRMNQFVWKPFGGVAPCPI